MVTHLDFQMVTQTVTHLVILKHLGSSWVTHLVILMGLHLVTHWLKVTDLVILRHLG